MSGDALTKTSFLATGPCCLPIPLHVLELVEQTTCCDVSGQDEMP